MGEGTGREAGKDQQANQILEGSNAPLPILSFGGCGSSKVFPDLVCLAGWQSGRLWIPGKGERWKEKPPPPVVGVLVDKSLLPLALCSHSSILLDQCPQRRPGLLTYSTWLLLAAPAHKCCFRIKELGTIETGSGPAEKSARPVQFLQVLGSQRALGLLTWWLTQVGPHDH